MVEGDPIQDVNIELGDDMSRMFDEAAKLTYDNRSDSVYRAGEDFGDFRGIRGAIFAKDISKIIFCQGFDGIGTKVEVAERVNNHLGSGYDLFAMAFDDVPRVGGEVISVGTILDVRKLDEKSPLIKSGMRQLAQGMVGAARMGKAVVINGEIAELGSRVKGYGDFNYNWGAGVWWAVHEERILDGSQIRAGDSLVGLKEPGFRSNGMTAVRKAMKENYGSEWHSQVERSLGNIALGSIVQTPSNIYSGFITSLTGGVDIEKEPKAKITGVANITGGGQPSKLRRMLRRSGLGATIHNPIDPPPVMTHVQKLRGFSDFPDEEAYKTWHMGPGMVIVTPEPEKVRAEAEEDGVEAQEIGEVTDRPGIRILNRGAEREKEWLNFP